MKIYIVMEEDGFYKSDLSACGVYLSKENAINALAESIYDEVEHFNYRSVEKIKQNLIDNWKNGETALHGYCVIEEETRG